MMCVGGVGGQSGAELAPGEIWMTELGAELGLRYNKNNKTKHLRSHQIPLGSINQLEESSEFTTLKWAEKQG